MINDVFIKLPNDEVYDQYKPQISPESIVFIDRKGSEKILTQNASFYFVPMDGQRGDVLRYGNGAFQWEPQSNVKFHNSVANMLVDASVYMITLGSNDEGTEQTFHFTTPFYEGQDMTIYFTKGSEYAYGTTVVFNKSEFISMNGNYSVVVEENKWKRVYIICDGNNMYLDIQDVCPIVKGEQPNSLLSNGTQTSKNQYEFVVGRYNKSTRQTSNNFGVKNSLLTVGNGLSDNEEERHDAFVVLQDGTIQVPLTLDGSEQSYEIDDSKNYYEKPMVCLQNWINNKMDKPENDGSVGQILSKSEDGVSWIEPLKGNYIQEIKQNGGYITYKSTNFRTGNYDENTIDFKTINGESIFGQGDIEISGGGGSSVEFPDGEEGQVLTKTADGVAFKNLPGNDGLSILRISRSEYNSKFNANELDNNTLYLITG